jgi:septum formation topological specificity factor MinE
MFWQTPEGRKEENIKREMILWSKKEAIPIYRVEFVSGLTKHLVVFIFYKKDEELKAQIENDKIEKTKEEIIQILNKHGYVEQYSDGITIEFDSHENVKKNYKGNYFFRLR